MFLFERFMGVLKKYVHQRARPQGSITKGYGTDEVIEFCVEFISELDLIDIPKTKGPYDPRLKPFPVLVQNGRDKGTKTRTEETEGGRGVQTNVLNSGLKCLAVYLSNS
jgi:hypothetical protein